MARLPKLAVVKFASCDGCQLSLLDCEDELLTLADAVDIAHFPEASRALRKGPYDVMLVEGSITTPHDAERLHALRRSTRVLVTIGACATAGGIQALRNFAIASPTRPQAAFPDLRSLTAAVYPTPEYVATLETSTPIAQHVRVDFELRGCPISKLQLLELLGAYLQGRKPLLPTTSVCLECKTRGTPCVQVARGTPCLGPATQAGCGALCPAFGRGCYGCFGPMESPNTEALSAAWRALGRSDSELVRAWRSFNAWAAPFRHASESHERPASS
jgi:coenzyme F420-reducing hydrogenase gamma subunit